jgi:hypothetical protein
MRRKASDGFCRMVGAARGGPVNWPPNEQMGRRVVSTVGLDEGFLVSCTYYLPKLLVLSGLSPRTLVNHLGTP